MPIRIRLFQSDLLVEQRLQARRLALQALLLLWCGVVGAISQGLSVGLRLLDLLRKRLKAVLHEHAPLLFPLESLLVLLIEPERGVGLFERGGSGFGPLQHHCACLLLEYDRKERR